MGFSGTYTVFPKPLIKVSGLPSFGQVAVTQKGKSRIVHLLTYIPELRGKQMQIIEEPIVEGKIGLALRSDGQKVKDVYLAPSREKLGFRFEGNYIKITIPEVNGYQMVVFE